MRVHAFRAWFVGAMNHGVGAAKRAGHAVTRKIRDMRGQVDAGAAIGDDDAEFGGGRSRAWFQQLEEYVERFLRLFEKSTFERFRPGDFVRRLLGLPPRAMPEIQAPKKPPKKQITAPNPIDPKEAARLKAEIRQQMIMANARGAQNLRPLKVRSQSVTPATEPPSRPPSVLASESDAMSAPTDPRVPVVGGPPLPAPREIATESALAPELSEETATQVPIVRPANALDATQGAVPTVSGPIPRSATDETWAHEETSGRQRAVDAKKLDPRTLTTDFDLELRSMAAPIADRATEPPPAPPQADLRPPEPAVADIRHVQTQPLTEALPAARRPAPRGASFADPELSTDYFEETDPEAKALEATEEPRA